MYKRQGEQKIEDARKEISEIEEPEWIVTDRNDLPEYSDYGDNEDRIKSIGEVFPCLLYTSYEFERAEKNI